MDAIPPKVTADHRLRRRKINIGRERWAENSAAAADVAGVGQPVRIQKIPHFIGLFIMARALLSFAASGVGR